MASPFMGEDTTQIVGTSRTDVRERGTFETIGNAISLSARDMTTNSLIKIGKLNELNSEGEKLNARELRERFPEHKDLFTFPLTELAAQEIIKESEIRANLEQEIARGPSQPVLNFIAGIIPHALDPVDLAAGFGVGAVVKGAMAGTRLLKAIEASRAAKVGFEVGEAAIGNLAVEPVTLAVSGIEAREYGAVDAFINSVGGAVFGVGLRVGGKLAVGAAADGVRKVARRGKSAMEINLKTAMAQMDSGRMANTDPILKDIINETAPTARQFTRIDPDNISSGKLYGAARTPTDVKTDILGDDFGDGFIYTSTDQGSANGLAASKMADSRGAVIEYEITEKLNTIDLDKVASEDFKASVSKVSADTKITNDMTARDIFTALKEDIALGRAPEEALEEIAEDLRAKGYDGYYHDNRIQDGGEAPLNNTLAIFNPAKLKEVSRIDADASKIAAATPEEAVKIHSKDASRDDSPFLLTPRDVDEAARDISTREFKSTEEADLDKIHEQHIKRAENLVRQKLLTEADVERLKASGSTVEEVSQMLEVAYNCAAGAL